MGKKRKKHTRMARMPTTEQSTTNGPHVQRSWRAVSNTGYSENGASYTKGSLAAWHPIKSSPQSDIDSNLGTLRNRSADLYLGTPTATAAINTSRTNIIGAGLRVSPRPAYKILGITAEEGEEWSRKTKAEFDLWASSKECDIYGRNNFYDMQDIAYVSYAVDGDSFAIFKYRQETPLIPYSLRIQLLEAARVGNPWANSIDGYNLPGMVVMRNDKNNNRIINGVEVDEDGKAVAYWVANRYQYDPVNMDKIPEWVRVEAVGKRSGMPNIIQICHDERPEQYRGVPKLAPVIETIKQMGRYTNAELTAAIVKSFFSLFIAEQEEHENGDFPISQVLGSATSTKHIPRINKNDLLLGAGTINEIPMGYKVETVDPQRSLSTFEPFISLLSKQVGAALGIPGEVLMKSFNSSYTASRAALLQAWSEFKMRRLWFSRDFCQPIYETWLMEAIVRGRIKAPGFFDDPIIRQAWTNAEWYGPVMGVLDPVKEAQSAQLRILFGLSTREKEAAEMTGTSWDENIERLAIENKRLTESGIPQYPTIQGIVTEPQNQEQAKGEMESS